jgi:hypothetical protein
MRLVQGTFGRDEATNVLVSLLYQGLPKCVVDPVTIICWQVYPSELTIVVVGVNFDIVVAGTNRAISVEQLMYGHLSNLGTPDKAAKVDNGSMKAMACSNCVVVCGGISFSK